MIYSNTESVRLCVMLQPMLNVFNKSLILTSGYVVPRVQKQIRVWVASKTRLTCGSNTSRVTN